MGNQCPLPTPLSKRRVACVHVQPFTQNISKTLIGKRLLTISDLVIITTILKEHITLKVGNPNITELVKQAF